MKNQHIAGENQAEKRYDILIVAPKYMVLFGIPSSVKVSVYAESDDAAHVKALTKFEEMKTLFDGGIIDLGLFQKA